MAEFTPSIVPLGSLAEVAAASAEVAAQEQQLYAIGDEFGTTMGRHALEP
jgi:hypothetical protein